MQPTPISDQTTPMKYNLPLLTGALLIAATAGACAQANTAVTDPVGYITLPVAGGGSTTAPALSYVSASLVNKIEVSAIAAGTSAGNTADFAAGVLPAAGTYGLNSLGQANYYMEIATGPNAGTWTDITANTATSLTLLDAIGTMCQNQSVKVRVHHTIASIFGATSAQVQLQKGAAIGQADELLVIEDPTNNVAKSFYFSTDDADFDNNEDGWVFANGNPAANYVIAPGVGLKVSRKNATPVSILQVGHVKTGPTILPVENGIQLVGNPRAVGSTFTLDNSGLLSSGLTGGLSVGAADELQELLSGAPLNFFYSTDDADFDNNPDGWVNAANGNPLTAEQKQLPEGTALAIKRKGAAFNWIVPAQPIAP